MKALILFVPTFVLLFLSCHKEAVQTEPVPIVISEKAQEVLSSNNQFGFDMLKQLFLETENQNMMISPLSIAQALSMTYNGARNQTKTAFENVLHYNGLSTEEINQTALDLTNALLNVDSRVDIQVANSIWYEKTFSVESAFISANQTYYHAEVSPLDFSDSESKNEINQWVGKKTNQKITRIIDQINPEDRMILVNAVYFKGAWKSKFDSQKTLPGLFHLEDGSSVSVPRMQQENDYSVFYSDNYSAIDLPYGQGNYSMLIFLPGNESSLTELINNFDKSLWDNTVSGLSNPTHCKLFLPKFKFEYETDLNQTLSGLGLAIAFTDQADFTGINKEDRLSVSKAKHKSYIEVNEEGTEAAAVTSVTVGITSVGPESNVFNVDHPYLFAIREKYTNAILFVGIVRDPTQIGN